MANIVVQAAQSNDEMFKFKVDVIEGDSQTTHKVELNRDFYQSLTDGKITPQEFIQCSFEFLLERESKESILSSFNISIISNYFPEYGGEIINYF